MLAGGGGRGAVGGTLTELTATSCRSAVGLAEAATVSLFQDVLPGRGAMPLDPRVAMGDLGNQDILAIFNRLRLVLSNQVAAAWRARDRAAAVGGGAARFVNGRIRPRGI